ncbi:MAG: alpha/beta hydrolase [Gemmatimonadaceae bacterium]|nr:alpha/beta hydrolase [Gemmatimonadaceae bacterium]
MRISLTRAALLGVLSAATVDAQSVAVTLLSTREVALDGGATEMRGLVALDISGTRVPKRFVLRVPPVATWNGGLVIGAHGGSGGDNYDRSGKVIGTDESALDDVVGRQALSMGFAYASVDRDGAGAWREGYGLTRQFTRIAAEQVARRLGRAPARTYLVGLSAGGGIARLAAEDSLRAYAGVLIIAGAGGDRPTRLDRQRRMAELWPQVDPRTRPELPADSPLLRAYADAVGTPIAARRLWPYTGASAVAATSRAAPARTDDATGVVQVPTIEVVGSWDDLVIREIRAYDARVRPRDLHRLYEVDGAWHMSPDDDGVWSFQYIAETRMKLGSDVADAMGEGASYLPTVRDAFRHPVRWVEQSVPPPPSRVVRPADGLQ